MNSFVFQVFVMRECSPQEWLDHWAAIYERDSAKYEKVYCELIGKHCEFAGEDFRTIGKWKDDAWTPNQWKQNVAKVAYVVWEQAATELPQCPQESGVRYFLNDWLDRTYTNQYTNGSRTMRFGLPRASTLLHFLSGARYPIFDRRVGTAMARLVGQPRPMPSTVDSYCDKYVPLFMRLASSCNTNDLRRVDKALFSYGRLPDGAFGNR